MPTETMYTVETNRPVSGVTVDELLDIAEAVMDELAGNCRMRAFGPVVTVPSAGGSLRVVYSVQASTDADAQKTSAWVLQKIDSVLASRGERGTTIVQPELAVA